MGAKPDRIMEKTIKKENDKKLRRIFIKGIETNIILGLRLE
jgi:hypothetical protein